MIKINKIKLLKTFDRVVGRTAVKTLSRIYKLRQRRVTSIEKILFIRPGGIGDAVLLAPAIASVSLKWPKAEIHVLAERRNAGVFRFIDRIDKTYLYDRGFDLFSCLKNGYDVVIDTEQWHRLSAVVAYLTGAPVRVGFNTNERAVLFTHPVQYSHQRYEVYSFFDLLLSMPEEMAFKPYELVFNPNRPFLQPDFSTVSEEIKDLVNEYLRTYEGYVVISPGASVPQRRWGGNKYAEVAYWLLKEEIGVVVIGTKDDRKDGASIVEKAPGVIDLTGKTDLLTVAYLLSRAKVFLGPDSGIMHIAYGIGTPTVSIFGSGIRAKWAPLGKHHRVIDRGLSCSPCTRFGYTPECKNDLKCLSEIPVEDVLKAVIELCRISTGRTDG